MPEVIDLISSPLPPPNRPQATSAAAAAPTTTVSSPQLPATTTTTTTTTSTTTTAAPQFTFSDDIDASSLFAYDDLDKLDKPAKKRRLSDELNPQHHIPTSYQSKSSNPFRFSDDDEDEVALPPVPVGFKDTTATATANTKKVTPWNAEDSDPIVFTSSAPREPVPAGRGPVSQRRTEFRRTDTITIESDDNDGYNGGNGKGVGGGRHEEIEDFSDLLPMDELMKFSDDFCERPTSDARPLFSSRTANLLASLENGTGTGSTTKKMTSRSRKRDTVKEGLSDNNDDLIEPPRPKTKTIKPTSQDKEWKAKEREATKAQRERERELDKERKAKLKEGKAKEKQLAADLAQANKSKVDKKESTPEMIIDIASSLEGSSVGNQAVEFMRRLGVEHTFFTSPIAGIVKWRRKTKATFNEALGYWEPCAMHIRPEKHILCLLTAQEFVDMVIASADSESLEGHVLKIKNEYPSCKPIYLIEGLTSWMRKNHNAKNRAYQAEVRRQFDPSTATATTTATSQRKQPETTPPIDDDTIEDALLNLQVTHACLIHHTSAPPDSAEWLKTFTEHVSTNPYRLEVMRGNDSAFCMDVGQVKTGEDQADTFVKMLQEVNRVTASMAYGIVARYPSIGDLVKAMKSGGPGLLEDVKKSANKNGALTDSRIGPAASKRLYKVFMGLDPSSTDI